MVYPLDGALEREGGCVCVLICNTHPTHLSESQSAVSSRFPPDALSPPTVLSLPSCSPGGSSRPGEGGVVGWGCVVWVWGPWGC